MSQQRYWVRRLGVAAAALLLVFGVVRVLGALVGGDGGDDEGDGSIAAAAPSGTGETSASPAPTESAPGTTASADTPVPEANDTAVVDDDPSGAASGGQVATTTTAAPTTTTAPGRRAEPPSAETPARVLVVGDSDAGTFGPYLETLLDDTGVIDTTVDYKVSSGLSRPDFFDWPAHLTATLPAADPDIVVVTFGGNDAQGISDLSGEFLIGDPVANEEEWTAEYQRRAGEVMDLLLEGGRTVIWVGIPNDDNPEVTARMSVQDQAAKAAAAARPAVQFVDTWRRFSGRSGNWAEWVVDPRDGGAKDVRADDGFHLNEIGAEILALDIARLIGDDLGVNVEP